MKFHRTRFNLIFVLPGLLGLLGVGGWGCRTTPGEEDLATVLRFYLETNPDPTDRHMTAVVGRSSPFELVVQDAPFLTEVFIKDATLVETLGGFEIKVQFDRQGTWLLEQYTTANIGKHFAIYAQFGPTRWLAAPLVTGRIRDGVFVFTPDTTREETERILLGLKNVADEVGKDF